MEGLNERDRPDPAKQWHEFRDHFITNSLLAIMRDIAYPATNDQVLYVIRQHHKHQHEMYLEKMQSARHERQKKKKKKE